MESIGDKTRWYEENIIQSLINWLYKHWHNNHEQSPPILDIEDLTFDNFSDNEFWNINLKWIEFLDDFFKAKQNNINFSKETIVHLVRLERFKLKHKITTDKICEIESIMIELLQESDNRENNFFAKHVLHLIEKKKILLHSLKDGLTKLNNRRFAQDMLKEHIKRFNRYWTVFSVLLIDIDYFKRINDNFWHNVWDVILEWFSKILKGCLREMDVASRWWWEEFLVILENCNEICARKKAEEIRQKIEDELASFISEYSPIQTKNPNNTMQEIKDSINGVINCDNECCKNREMCWWVKRLCIKEKITCSIWIATCSPDIKLKMNIDSTCEELVWFADHALYFAKENWRNQVY